MNRTVVFAHYDKNEEIEDYVVYYLKELKKIANNIIFVSDSYIRSDEIDRIKNIVTTSIVGHHGEYDFGSYKRGYLYAQKENLLSKTDELIFANDSCYGPLYSLKNMFDDMESKKLDFWGCTANPQGIKYNEYHKIVPTDEMHIQSYFIVFNKRIFQSDWFANFLASIKKEETKDDVIINYEVKLTRMLLEQGYKFDVYSQLSKNIICAHILAYRDLILKDKIPFLKRSIVLYKNTKDHIYPFHLKRLFKYCNYNYNLIAKDQKNNKALINIIDFCSHYLRFVRRNLIKIHINERKIYILNREYKF